jgi:hypothetical protein
LTTDPDLINDHFSGYDVNIPPLTSPFVQTADIDNVVIIVTMEESRMITVDQPIPDCPTIHVSRKNRITPQIFRRHLSITPFNQPNFGASLTLASPCV